VARREDSLALEADAQHLSTDVYTSLGVGAGLLVVWVTGWHWLDPVAAIGVAALILTIGWKLTRQAMQHLMDSSLPAAEIETIEKILKAHPRLLSWHRLRTRKSGSERHVDMHIVLDAETLLEEAHRIASDLEKTIARSLPNTQVVIHVDPHTDED
jgi:cation diffusion facilitator family transporter